MQNVTVQCPECSLRIVDTDHPDVVYERDGNGNVLCPNCKIPTKPIGLGAVVSAEEAFAHVNRELKHDELPPAETVESLTKRLRQLEHAQGRVMSAKATLDDARESAKEAKKHYDDEVETFLSLTRRLTSFTSPLPLFTKESEEAAQPDLNDTLEANREPQALWQTLMDAGYMAATVEAIASWDAIQRDQARGWAALGTVDGMPEFMQRLAEQVETEPQTATA